MADGWPLPRLLRRHCRRRPARCFARGRRGHRCLGSPAVAPRIARLIMTSGEPNKIEEPASRPAWRLVRLQAVKLPLWVSVVPLLVLLIVFARGRFKSGSAERRLGADRQQLAQKGQETSARDARGL